MAEWNTRFTDLVGCKYPIIQGAYGGFGRATIAGPVSKAGGLGIITAGACGTPDVLRQDIEQVRAMTNEPFGVNISVGLCKDPVGMLDVIIETKVPVFFTAAYKAEELGVRAKAAGIPWVHKVATVVHAEAAQRQGAEAVVLVGLEGAGFKNVTQLPTLINIPSAVNMLKVPVIAAGGIGDSRSFLAALGLGAEAAYLATAFMATTECPISKRYKQVLIDSVPWDPTVRDRCLAPPKPEEYDRVMKARASLPRDEWLRSLEMSFMRDSSSEEGAAPSGWTSTLEDDDEDMDTEQAFRNSGGSLAVGVLDRVKSAKELIDDIINGAEDILCGNTALGRIHEALVAR